MLDTKESRKLLYYVCGWCGDMITYAKGEGRPNPCPNCGWTHEDKHKYNDVPSEIKLDLSNL